MHAHTAARRPRDYCILDKNDLETWRDLHIVWHAIDGWITARTLMSFKQTDIMYVSDCVAPSPTDSLDVWQSNLVKW